MTYRSYAILIAATVGGIVGLKLLFDLVRLLLPPGSLTTPANGATRPAVPIPDWCCGVRE